MNFLSVSRNHAIVATWLEHEPDGICIFCIFILRERAYICSILSVLHDEHFPLYALSLVWACKKFVIIKKRKKRRSLSLNKCIGFFFLISLCLLVCYFLSGYRCIWCCGASSMLISTWLHGFLVSVLASRAILGSPRRKIGRRHDLRRCSGLRLRTNQEERRMKRRGDQHNVGVTSQMFFA